MQNWLLELDVLLHLKEKKMYTFFFTFKDKYSMNNLSAGKMAMGIRPPPPLFWIYFNAYCNKYYINIGVGTGRGEAWGGNYNHNSGGFFSFFLKISETSTPPPPSQFSICFRRHRLKSLNNGSYNLWCSHI